MSSDDPIKVLLVDDHAYVGDTLSRTFVVDGDIVLSGQLASPERLEEAVADLHPDVVLMDYLIPGFDTTRAMAELRFKNPGVGVIVYTGMMSDSDREAALQAGALACIGKYAPTSELLQSIRDAAAWSRADSDASEPDPSGPPPPP